MVHVVTAVIKPHKFEEVKEALRANGVLGLTASEVKGFGQQGGKTENYRGSEYVVDLIPKIKIEIVVDSNEVDSVMEVLAKAARTDKIGDGKIWSVSVDKLMRIRTGEMGDQAI
jgi:nitrogen regulatory protein P-II 1